MKIRACVAGTTSWARSTLSGGTVRIGGPTTVRELPLDVSLDTIFGMPDQKLIIRHASGTGDKPYVDGALPIIQRFSRLVGVHRGLDSVMDF